jgi:hypothetical protein
VTTEPFEDLLVIGTLSHVAAAIKLREIGENKAAVKHEGD